VAKAEKDFASLEWKAPTEDGGSKVTSYTVNKKEDKKEWKIVETIKAFDTSYKVTDLKYDIGYFFSVAAVNEAGPGNAVETTAVVKISKPAGVPSIPVGPLEFSDVQRESVMLTWKPSESDGGSPITNYFIEKRDVKKPGSWINAGKVSKTTSEFRADKLMEGTSYYFRVLAENKVGRSATLETDQPVTAKSPFGKNCVLMFRHLKSIHILKRFIQLIYC
jgi:predicted phage tail protein